MLQNGWKSLDSEVSPPRHFEASDEGWYRYSIVSEHFGATFGLRKLKELRSSSTEQRSKAAGDFAKKVAEFLPRDAWISFMPSSTRRSIDSSNTSISHLVCGQLRALRQDIILVEPLVRASSVPSVHEDRTHDILVLASTLQPELIKLHTDTLYVVDDMVATGATYAAFVRVFRNSWPQIRTVLLAYVFSSKGLRLFER